MIDYIKRAEQLFVEKIYSKYSRKYVINYNGQGIVNFIDVGSVGGLPVLWKKNANLVKFLLNFEPNEFASRGVDTLTYNTAVWDKDEILPFYIYKGFNSTGSSLFKQNFEYVKKNFEILKLRGPADLAQTWFERSALLQTVELRCKALDGILEEELPSVPFHFMKIDAQGAEFNILKGARALLNGSCVGLHLELFTLPLYVGIVLLDEVVEYLRGCGFRLIKKYPAHGTFDSQHDCLFIKDDSNPEILARILKIYGLPKH